MFERDYIQRVIKSIGQMAIAIGIGKRAVDSIIDEEKETVAITEDELLEIMIGKCLSDGKINEAENMIFEAMKSQKSAKDLEIALSFYEEINKWDEDKLAKYNFSKQEIVEGLEDVKKLYGLS